MSRNPLDWKVGCKVSTATITPVNSAADPRLVHYVDVRHRGTNPDADFFIAEGRWVVQQLIDSSYVVESLLVQSGVGEEFAALLNESVPIYSLDKSELERLVGFDFHRGVMACGRRQSIPPWDRFANQARQTRLSLAPVCVTEPANLGSMLRTAAGLGIEDVCLGPGTHDPLARRVIRTSMATVFKQRLFQFDDPPQQLRRLVDQHGFRTIATTLAEDAVPIDEYQLGPEPALLLVGNEAAGLSPEIQAVATDRVTIPMRLGVDSLNVAIAAAITMYELTKHCYANKRQN